MTDRAYCYPPDFSVLRNKFNIRDAATLEAVERNAVRVRASEAIPQGQFDLAHLQAIHAHLFQDVYDWAGDIRVLEIAKGGQQFQPRGYIGVGMADVYQRLQQQNYLRHLSIKAFAEAAGRILGDVNYVHPFREGNGRAQLIYLRQLGRQAGHAINLSLLERDAWIEASIQSHRGNYDPMAACVLRAIEPPSDANGAEFQPVT
jgi:cell filamentation protein